MGNAVDNLAQAQTNFRALLEEAMLATDVERERVETLRVALISGNAEDLPGAGQGGDPAGAIVQDIISLLPVLADLTEQAAAEMVEAAREAEREAADFYNDAADEWQATKGDKPVLAAVAEGGEVLALPKESWNAAKSKLSAAQQERRKLLDWAETLRTPKIEGMPWAEFADALETADVDGDLGKAALLVSLRPHRQRLQGRLHYLDLDRTLEAVLISCRLIPSGPVGTILYTESQSQSASPGGAGVYRTSWQYGLLSDVVDTELLKWLKRDNIPQRRRSEVRHT